MLSPRWVKEPRANTLRHVILSRSIILTKNKHKHTLWKKENGRKKRFS